MSDTPVKTLPELQKALESAQQHLNWWNERDLTRDARSGRQDASWERMGEDAQRAVDSAKEAIEQHNSQEK